MIIFIDSRVNKKTNKKIDFKKITKTINNVSS